MSISNLLTPNKNDLYCDDLTVGGNLTVGGDLTVNGEFNLLKSASVVLNVLSKSPNTIIITALLGNISKCGKNIVNFSGSIDIGISTVNSDKTINFTIDLSTVGTDFLPNNFTSIYQLNGVINLMNTAQPINFCSPGIIQAINGTKTFLVQVYIDPSHPLPTGVMKGLCMLSYTINN